MLRLAHPAPRGQGTDPPKRRKGLRSPSLTFTPEETRHVHAALRNAARAYGGMDALATVIGVPVATLYQAARAHRTPSGILAIRLAAAAGISVEAMLAGKLADAGRCPTCGHRAAGGAP